MTRKGNSNYDDIIHLPHHRSTRHPPMSPLNRAAQFSPFAALTGHGAAIRETERLTDSFIELDEGAKARLDRQLQWIRQISEEQPEIDVTFFKPDGKKNGGSYITFHGQVKKIDEYNHQLLFTDGTILPIEYLFSITGEQIPEV